ADIDTRQGDALQFQRFLKLAGEAQDAMASDTEVTNAGERLAREALGVFGVLTADDWLARLDNAALGGEQKRQVRETAYVTLVSLADFHVRWLHEYKRAAGAATGLD